MPHPCVVCGRSRMNPNNREEEYLFYGFPVNYDTRCKKWLEFCCREDLYKLTKKQLLQRMVCSKHFERKDFLNEYQDRLNCTAVPSIYDPKQSLYNITCVLCARSRRDPPSADYDGTTFHHFPGEEFRCLKWLDFVGIDSYYRLTRKEILYCYICSRHFDKSQFIAGYRGRLIDNAVPNIRSPEKGNAIEAVKIERNLDPKIYHASEKSKRQEPLSTAVLESQACAACGRSRSDPRNKVERYKFHPFPAYEIGRCLRWCQFLGREDLLKMSPNQIRKLVLCSKHFLAGQSFHKVGPCDAVPTIKEITDSHDADTIETRNADDEPDETEDGDHCGMKISKRQDFQRPLVSSKKPKIENKPAPLAKKRGRSKRPTSINIPKLDTINIENRVSKLPLPPANWKIQIGNQFQPLTIADANNTNAITTDGKKVILPFTSNISNLGAPIPVHSLSAIPPGFLIKINLPDQEAKPTKTTRKQRKEKKIEDEKNIVAMTSDNKPAKRRRKKKIVDLPISEKNDEMSLNHDMCELISFPLETQELDERIEDKIHEAEIDIKEDVDEESVPDIIEVLEEDFEQMEGDDIHGHDQEAINVYQEIPDVEEFAKQQRTQSRRQRTTMTARARRTLLPIRTEVRYFLQKLTPHMRRLPQKARAQLKLSIVNMVIDRL